MTTFRNKINEKMIELSKDNNTIFIGQQVADQDFYGTLKYVPIHQRIEMPVAEEMQMGIAIGLALEGFRVVCIYQRVDFIMRAMDQLVNHLDIMKEYTRGKFISNIIIRSTIGSHFPMNVGLQHNKDLIELLKKSVSFPVIEVTHTDIYYNIPKDSPSMFIERQDDYDKEI